MTTTWRDQLDARINRCPGCDDWRWDHHCPRCDTTTTTDSHHADPIHDIQEAV